MAQFQPGFEGITHVKADVTQNLETSTTVTANGVRGKLTLTIDGAIANNNVGGAFTFNNSFIEPDSMVNLMTNSVDTAYKIPVIPSAYNISAGSCSIKFVNITGQAIADNSIIGLAYEIIN